jgi:hypothetical protein
MLFSSYLHYKIVYSSFPSIVGIKSPSQGSKNIESCYNGNEGGTIVNLIPFVNYFENYSPLFKNIIPNSFLSFYFSLTFIF